MRVSRWSRRATLLNWPRLRPRMVLEVVWLRKVSVVEMPPLKETCLGGTMRLAWIL